MIRVKYFVVHCSLCWTNMKMDGFGKFFDQPSCEFGGKYMEVRGGGDQYKYKQKEGYKQKLTLGDYRISYSKYVKVKRNPNLHDLHETGDKNNYFDHSKITFQRALHIRAKYFVFPPESNSI